MARKSFISFILLCCFVVIPAHNMVPHHHHDGVFIPVEASSCPGHRDDNHTDHHHGQQGEQQQDSQDAQHDHNRHPLHCHAFNEISFYKNVLPGISQPSEAPVLYANQPSAEQSTCKSAVARRLTIIRSVPFQSRHDRQAVPLRGPPPVA